MKKSELKEIIRECIREVRGESLNEGAFDGIARFFASRAANKLKQDPRYKEAQKKLETTRKEFVDIVNDIIEKDGLDMDKLSK